MIKKDAAAMMNPMIAHVSRFLPDSLLPPGKLPITISYPEKIIIIMANPAEKAKTNLIVCAMKAGMHWPALIMPSVKSHPTLLRLESMSEGVLAAACAFATSKERILFIRYMLPHHGFRLCLSGFTKLNIVILQLMKFSWDAYPRPFVCLAPMAGVTDGSYRQLIKKLAPETIVYTEFLSTDAIHYGAKKTMKELEFDKEEEHPFIVQVFGKEPEHFLSAAKVIEEMGADGIDINMGCPAAKVVSSCHGSALLKNADLAKRLVEATKKEVSIPVSVKTRLGWDNIDDLIPFCQGLVDAGADALAIHGRTYEGKFGGEADWNPIYELKENVSVPVIGNGDITCAQDAVDKIKNLDGVMVGRGTFGNPWVMKDITEAFRLRSAKCKVQSAKLIPTVDTMTFEEKIPFIIEHCELAVKVKGQKRGMLEMRRHLASYVKGIDGASDLRAQLVRVESVEEVQNILSA